MKRHLHCGEQQGHLPTFLNIAPATKNDIIPKYEETVLKTDESSFT